MESEDKKKAKKCEIKSGKSNSMNFAKGVTQVWFHNFKEYFHIIFKNWVENVILEQYIIYPSFINKANSFLDFNFFRDKFMLK